MAASLIDRIMEAGSRNPAAAAFIYQGRIITYKHLRAFISVTARMLHDRGIKPNDIVGLTMGQSPLHCIALLALARLGAISVPLSPSLAINVQMGLINRYGICVIVTDHDIEGLGEIATFTLDNVTAAGNEADLDFISYKPDDKTPLRVALSSGTTGEPKGVMNTHGYLVDRIDKTLLDYDSGSRLIPPDLHQTIALPHTYGTLCIGGTIVFPHTYNLPDLISAINLYAVTHVLLSPAKAMQMVDLLPESGVAFPTLKHLRIMGARPSLRLLEMLRRRFSPNIYNPYGSTELGVISLATPETFDAAPESAGRLLPWAKAEVLDPHGKVLPPGETGEIRFAMDMMPTEYFRDEEHTREKFRNGWFYPGDMGHISADGLLYIEGRTDNLVNIGGHKVTTDYIEEILGRHPKVREVAVLLVGAIEDDAQSLAAVIIPDGNPLVSDLVEHSRRHLGVLAPQKFFFVTDLPRNLSGKVVREELLQIVQNLLASDTHAGG